MEFNINNIGADSDSIGAIHYFLFCESLIIHFFQIKEKSDQCGFQYLKNTYEQVNIGSEAWNLFFMRFQSYSLINNNDLFF